MFDIDQILINESGRIGPDIHRKLLHTSVWNSPLIQKGSWPDEMGDEISVMTYERSLPANTLTWDTVTYNTGSGSNCVPTAEVVNFAQTLRTYNLQQTALESPPFCKNDLRFTVKRKEQLSNIFAILTENTKYAWENRHRDEYVRLAGHKVVLTAAMPEGSASFPLVTPVSKLTQGALNRVRMKLIRDGAGINPITRANGTPVFGLVTSSETSESIIKDNEDIRQDYRWSDKVNELLAPMGIERSYAGFVHMIDDFNPRYDFVDGAWVRRYPYSAVATTQGNKFDINPLYEAAAYEDSIIFHKDVMECLIPKPITAPGGNTKFDPVSYTGDWSWKNILDRTENPDGTIGYFRGILSSGSKPLKPEWGYVIRHLRCDSSLNLLACS
jgi:hypothetical protein